MTNNTDPEAAANLIRQKVAGLYQHEPNARKELSEAEASEHRSKHQQFIHELSSSGKSLAEIQTAWHDYYQTLSNDEKHQVWHEFYKEYDKQQGKPSKPVVIPANMEPRNPLYDTAAKPKPKMQEYTAAEPTQTMAGLKKQLLEKVGTRAKKTSAKEHVKSLAFGLVCGFVALVIFLFGFFNERFVAPFITPSKNVSNAPIVIDASTAAAGPEPIITIPKINVQIPVVYTEPSVDEDSVQRALEGGVLHYATTPNPGEKGNSVIFGHSSNNIFNKGKYKFAFVLLKQLEPGDTFTVQKDGKRYVYKVFEKKIVSPNDLSVLGQQGNKAATMTLITCDPPGTSVNRMVVIGEQISPDPLGNVASSAKQDSLPVILPSNAPSLWSRFYDWATSW